MRTFVLVGLLVAGAVTARSPVEAPTRDVLGLTLGSNMVIEECPLMDLAGLVTYAFEHEIKIKPCFQSRRKAGEGSAAINPAGERLRLVLSETPVGIKSGFALADVVHGKLEGLSLATTGEAAQEHVYKMLVEKYGAPTRTKREALQNRMGATFTAIGADWVFSDLVVEFSGFDSSLDSGSISFSTPTGRGYQLKIFQERKDRGAKL